MNKKVSDLVLLDAGAGTGNYIPYFKDLVSKVIVVEYNEGMIQKAKDKFKDEKNITFV